MAVRVVVEMVRGAAVFISLRVWGLVLVLGHAGV